MTFQHFPEEIRVNRLLVIALLVAGCGLGLGSPGLAQSTATAKAKPASTASRAKAGAAAPLAAPQLGTVGAITDVDPHRAFGSKGAPIIMEVFSDFQCPACKNLYLTTNRQLMDNYVSTGKVYLIHRDFPLQMHAYSRVAAQYARAAAQLGKGEAVEQALFENQEKWEQTGDVDAIVASVVSAADLARIRAAVKDKTMDPAIERDMALGRSYNVTQTPTTVFHAKGQTYPFGGGMTYATLSQFLDQLLAQR
jgi:protein-disulfide isomerase